MKNKIGLNKLIHVRFAVSAAVTEILNPEDGSNRFLQRLNLYQISHSRGWSSSNQETYVNVYKQECWTKKTIYGRSTTVTYVEKFTHQEAEIEIWLQFKS
jgi:hypothetical protein